MDFRERFVNYAGTDYYRLLPVYARDNSLFSRNIFLPFPIFSNFRLSVGKFAYYVNKRI